MLVMYVLSFSAAVSHRRFWLSVWNSKSLINTQDTANFMWDKLTDRKAPTVAEYRWRENHKQTLLGLSWAMFYWDRQIQILIHFKLLSCFLCGHWSWLKKQQLKHEYIITIIVINVIDLRIVPENKQNHAQSNCWVLSHAGGTLNTTMLKKRETIFKARLLHILMSLEEEDCVIFERRNNIFFSYKMKPIQYVHRFYCNSLSWSCKTSSIS